MQYLRYLIGAAIVLVIVLYFLRPAEPQSGFNRLSYDGERLSLNGRGVAEADLLNVDFPEDAEVQLDLSDIKHTDLGAESGLLHHWNQEGVDYFHAVNGVPVTVDQLSWRLATKDELRKEIYEENERRAAVARARQATAKPKRPAVDPATVTDRSPPPEIVEEEKGFEAYVPTDKNRYLWNGEPIGTAAQAEKFFGTQRFSRPSALLVMVPKGSAPPAGATEIAELGFPPAVTGLLERVSDAGVYVRVHRGEGFRPTGASQDAFTMFGGLFFAYLGPIVLMLIGVFFVMWFLEGGKADHES